MAKRRFRSGPDADKAPEELSPEERRDRRRDDRARAARGKRPKEPRTGWRRGIVPVAVVSVLVAVILILWFGVGLLFPHPCLNFQPIPQTSGPPNFPTSNTTDFTGTWCPQAATLFSIHPDLSISINGHSVGLPPSIGRSLNYTHYECDLPIHTEPGVAGGVFNVSSPWAYSYNLSNFFTVWQESYVSAFVNSTYSSRTIDYTSTQLLGLSVDASHTLRLFVDNQVSSAGPGLVLNSLNNQGGSTPSCIDSIYGGGHTIALVYSTVGAGAVVPGHAPIATTLAPALPAVYGSPMYVPLTEGTPVEHPGVEG
ncbi:MAG: hypothetical protein L3J91_03005, partial [Thermoplasmata archaeon]|nr:hypothetical protein [Thermoplasmata archaeon]